MFCSKCGSQISETDQYCPKCGKENINYVPPNSESIKKILSNRETLLNSGKEEDKEKTGSGLQKRMLPVIIAVCAVAVVIVCFLILGQGGGKSSIKENSTITYQPSGLEGYIGNNGSVYFVENGSVRKTIKGKIKSGKSTPDRKWFLVLFDSGRLNMYDDTESEPIQISMSADNLSTVTDVGCFYKSNTDKLYYYDFETNESIETGITGSSYEFSNNGNSVIGQGNKDDVRIYTVGNTESRVLFGAEALENIYDICCIADDGSNLIWTIQDGSTFNIYMMKNNAPERIGKITNADKYASVSGLYYNNGQSFVVYSPGSAQMICGKSGEISEITLPGVMNGGAFYNTNGEIIRSNGDYIEEPYIILSKTKSSKTGGLYRLMKDGSAQLDTDGVNLENTWSYSTTYYLKNGWFYFIDSDNDLCKKKLGEGNEIIPMTTDVRAFYVPTEGGYAYIIKSAGLYYMDLSDNDAKLELIWNNISDDDKFYLTDKNDTIYFLTEIQEIKDSYLSKGTLYQYTVGGEAKQIVKNVLYLTNNGERSISADTPIIEQYESHEKYDFVINVGTCIEGEYKELIRKAKD